MKLKVISLTILLILLLAPLGQLVYAQDTGDDGTGDDGTGDNGTGDNGDTGDDGTDDGTDDSTDDNTTDDTTDDNSDNQEADGSPGFELIFLLGGILVLILILKRRK